MANTVHYEQKVRYAKRVYTSHCCVQNIGTPIDLAVAGLAVAGWVVAVARLILLRPPTDVHTKQHNSILRSKSTRVKFSNFLSYEA